MAEKEDMPKARNRQQQILNGTYVSEVLENRELLLYANCIARVDPMAAIMVDVKEDGLNHYKLLGLAVVELRTLHRPQSVES